MTVPDSGPLSTVALEGDVLGALKAVPTSPGVGQLVASSGKSLVIGRCANLRRWASGHLGGKRPKAGARPPVDLTPVTSAIAFRATTSPFEQRLVYERLMNRLVPASKRKDLKPAVYLDLDPRARFPRIVLRKGPSMAPSLFGPFRDSASAEDALKAANRAFRLRPCDYSFEPSPTLPLGLSCVFAQVGSCAAPCLVRTSEEHYRALAEEAVLLLSRPARRPEGPLSSLDPWISKAEALAVVAQPGSAGLELYPIISGAVVEEARCVRASGEPLLAAASRLSWSPRPEGRDDSAWLVSWLKTPRRTGSYLLFEERPSPSELEESLKKVGLGSEE